MRLAWAVLLLALVDATMAAQLESLSPQGEVKDVRQVAARFSEPMVAFGDPRLPDPFEVDCAVPGRGQWVDARNWIYDFERDLPAGLRCTFTLKPDLQAVSGAALEPHPPVGFSTGGPAILESLPYEGTEVDEEQAFILVLDAPASAESVAANAWCDIAGVAERVDVQVLEGDARKAILAARRDAVRGFLRSHAGESGASRRPQDLDAEDLPLAVLQCKRRLPNNAQVQLVWGKGIRTPGGVETSQDQRVAFRVRDVFQARFSCERANREADCLPILPMRVAFTAPVSREQAQKIVLKPASGPAIAARLPDARNAPDFVQEVSFPVPLPERSEFTVVLPPGMTDDAGRKLSNQKRFPLAVRTDEHPPLAKFASRFGIIELKGDAMLPVTLRNLEAVVQGRMASTARADDPESVAAEKAEVAIDWLRKKMEASRSAGGNVPGAYSRVADGDVMAMIGWMRRLRQMEIDRWRYDEASQKSVQEYRVGQASIFEEGDRTRRLQVPKPGGARAFEVVGIPLRKPGFYVVELASPRLGAALLDGPGKPFYVQAAALVTNLAVHFKWGREASLAWVTALDTGKPVAGAQVSVQDCSGKVHFRGTSDAQGRVRITAALPAQAQLPTCLGSYDRQLVVSARLGEDLSFVMSDWNEGIARWRFNLREASWNGPYIATTVFDRTLFRAGETVGMKHYYRRHGVKGFDLVDAAKLPKIFEIQHQGSGDKYEIPVQWDARSSAESSWKIPEGAKKGIYTVVMTDNLEPRPGWRGSSRISGSFRVEEFRVPLMKAEITGPRTPQVNPDSVPLSLNLRYLAGGAAANVPVRVRAVVRPRTVSFAAYEGFSFANGRVKEGIEAPAGAQGDFGDEEDAGGMAAPAAGVRPLRTVTLELDAGGSARVPLADIPAADSPQELNAEFEYADPNGEVLTASTRVPLWPSAVVLGIKPDAWAASADSLKFQVLALDLAGKPLKGQAVRTQLYVRESYAHRKRLVGGFYGYESGAEVKKLEAACEGVTDANGRIACEVKSPASGNILLAAETRDRAGNPSWAQASVWVAGKDAWWFDQGNDDRMDVIPERKRYEPGQTASLQVRMPFREATALVTVEREGVIESFVQPLTGTAPVIKLPIKATHAPNVFVSVLAVRGRAGGTQPTALIDLGKPAFRMGVAEINVGWRAHELNVKVSTDKPVYRTRDKARVSVQVTQRAGGKPPQAGEVAIAAVDEGLLELLPNDSWKLLDAMMQPRGIDVETSTASMQVVGKRHYGRKALAQGGGGGRETSRELFDTLLFWKARVPLDAKGRAQVEVPLNDSLTSFRIIAVADAGKGQFGTGQASMRATQDLMLLSGLPSLVREGDRFEAGFTVRNASERSMQVEVNGKLAGKALPAVQVRLAAGESRVARWEVTVPAGVAVLNWEVAAREKPAGLAPGEPGTAASVAQASDRLKLSQNVVPAVPERTFQATLTQLEQPLALAVNPPGDALPGRGGLRLSMLPRLGDSLAGVREYMAAYPYICLEQRASRAIALRDEALWARIMAELPSFLDRDGFAKYFPAQREGSDALTAYLLAIAHEAGWRIDEGPLSRMQEALRRFAGGRVGRDSPLPTADLTIRKLAALEALSRYGALEPGLLDSIEVAPNLWPTSAVLDWHGVLTRSESLPDRQKRLAEAEQILRSRLDFRGTTMGFSTERTDYLWWLMVSGDSNANRLLLAVLESPAWREDIPRLVRGSLGRQQQGHWNTTVANAWGTLAMQKFSARFESEPVTGRTLAQLDGQQRGLDWDIAPRGGEMDLRWPPREASLSVQHEGSGRPWVMVSSRAAIPLTAPLSSGFQLRRTVVPVETRVPGMLSRGDSVRVRLEVEAQSDMAWVVVDDPVPAGGTVLGGGLGGDSQVLWAGEARRGFVQPAFEERSFQAFRAYYRFVPKGSWTVEYTLRLNNPGRFELPPTRVEAMYAPEMFGELPNAAVEVQP